jgi:hypothetical protein
MVSGGAVADGVGTAETDCVGIDSTAGTGSGVGTAAVTSVIGAVTSIWVMAASSLPFADNLAIMKNMRTRRMTSNVRTSTLPPEKRRVGFGGIGFVCMDGRVLLKISYFTKGSPGRGTMCDGLWRSSATVTSSWFGFSALSRATYRSRTFWAAEGSPDEIIS